MRPYEEYVRDMVTKSPEQQTIDALVAALVEIEHAESKEIARHIARAALARRDATTASSR